LKLSIYAFSAVILTASVATYSAHAQSQATAVQNLDLSAFGAVTDTSTGLQSGQNVGITAGADIGIRRFSWFRPSIEVRGTYPVYRGDFDSAKNILGGLKFEKRYHRFHPYVDALYGRGEINYANGGYPDPQQTFRYTKSPSNVLSVGGGVDFDLTYHFSVKADAQFERYATPVTTSGHLYTKPFTLGVVYRFNFTKVYVPPS
jgi:hypothetical protein